MSRFDDDRIAVIPQVGNGQRLRVFEEVPPDDLQATLDAIDRVAVHECGHCRRPLRPDGPSPDYCGPWCQEAWLAAKQEIIDLVRYREPYDLPQHVDNLVELSSPETTPPWQWPPGVYEFSTGFRLVSSSPSEVTYSFTFDTSRLEAAFERAAGQMRELAAAWDGMSISHVVIDEPWDRQLLGLDPLRAVSFGYREEPEPEPCAPPEMFGADFDFEHRPAATLPDEPPPAVMPALPERDWQALVDARTRSGPERQPRAPRQLGRRTR